MAKEKDTREEKRGEFYSKAIAMEVSILEVFINYFNYL
jgi:hypothetical protein